MGSKQQTDVNMKAAKMLYPNDTFNPLFGSHSTIQSESSGFTDAFNIFTNAQDLMNVVIALGEKHKAYLYYDAGWDVKLPRNTHIIIHGTYVEAVAAAVMEISYD